MLEISCLEFTKMLFFFQKKSTFNFWAALFGYFFKLEFEGNICDI